LEKGKTKGVSRLIDATCNSLAGLKAAWKHEEAFRLEAAFSLIMIPAAFWLGATAAQKALLIGSCFLVLIAELLNSAVEAVVDRIGTEWHELSGRAKDIGSAAVCLSLVNLSVVWVLIAAERFFM
jgi:diacylglycerol kinase (ATP)